MANDKPEQERISPGGRWRRAALFVLFSLVLLIPKTLALRQRRWVWNGLRLVVALFGAFLVSAVRGDPTARISPLVGLLLVLIALLVRPAKKERSVDEQAAELGALVVLNGGRFRPANQEPTRVRLFVAPQRLHVLDLQHRPLLEIPLASVSSLRAQGNEPGPGWQLVVEWGNEPAAFHYQGFFAEHLARVAETTLRAQLRRELPLIG